MGGQNHQPTNRLRLIAPSAWLSHLVGSGFGDVLRANSELEMAIIAGMEHLHVEGLAPELPNGAETHMRSAVDLLGSSLATLPRIREAFDNLLEAAAAEGYRGNPLASRVAEFGLSAKFDGGLIAPGVNQAVWSELEGRIAERNVLETLAWEATCFALLEDPMRLLIAVLNDCLELARTNGARAMVEAIECNEVPLRQRFAPVFSRWNHLHAMFLYSALMMTELFYLTNSIGSLAAEPARSAASAA